jgi:hypothetical protein
MMKKDAPPKNMNVAHKQKAKPASLTKRWKARLTLFGLITKSQMSVATETKKISNCLSTEAVVDILKIKAGLRFKNNLHIQIT